jgi:hypothetical protein
VNSFKSLENNTRGEPDSIVSLAKWRILNRLHDRNETLYYRVNESYLPVPLPFLQCRAVPLILYALKFSVPGRC